MNDLHLRMNINDFIEMEKKKVKCKTNQKMLSIYIFF